MILKDVIYPFNFKSKVLKGVSFPLRDERKMFDNFVLSNKGKTNLIELIDDFIDETGINAIFEEETFRESVNNL